MDARRGRARQRSVHRARGVRHRVRCFGQPEILDDARLDPATQWLKNWTGSLPETRLVDR
jgi:hypothetical protein